MFETMFEKIIKHDNDRDTYIIYIENVIDDDKLLKYLEVMDDFEGAEKYTHRLQKWYQTDNLYFSKKWKNQSYKRWISKEYDDGLSNIQNYIQNITNNYIKENIKFNSCLINKYRDGNDIIKPHRDAIESFGEYPVISNLSIGGERVIKFESIETNFSITLKSGSLLIMAGSSQKKFRHSIPTSDNHNVRYSMTFREFII